MSLFKCKEDGIWTYKIILDSYDASSAIRLRIFLLGLAYEICRGINVIHSVIFAFRVFTKSDFFPGNKMF